MPAVRARRSACALNSRRSLHFVPLCTHTEHLLLAVVTFLAEAALTVMYCKYIPCVTIISGTPIAGNKVSLRVQSERSERLRELTPAARRRGRYFIDRCAGGACPHWAIRGGRCATLRSALEPNIYYSRSLLFGRSGFAKCGMWKVEFGIVVRCGKATAEYNAPARYL